MKPGKPRKVRFSKTAKMRKVRFPGREARRRRRRAGSPTAARGRSRCHRIGTEYDNGNPQGDEALAMTRRVLVVI
jgi:hypothetical protein